MFTFRLTTFHIFFTSIYLSLFLASAKPVELDVNGEINPSNKQSKIATKKFKFCPVKACAKEKTELEAWDCVSRYLFRDRFEGENATLNHNGYLKDVDEKIVQHDCGGVGWGNNIRGMYNAASLACILGRRLSVIGPNNIFNKVFLPPYEEIESWDYGIGAAAGKSKVTLYRGGISDPAYHEVFDYEKHGRPPDRWTNWTTLVRKHGSNYDKTVLQGGICGGEREFVTKGSCVALAMPKFGKCAREVGGNLYMPEPLLAVPFFYKLFSRPAPIMAEKLSIIRERLNLPALEAGTEPRAGAWGLRTPGYYILAMHFRRVPLGFEPSSVELNKKDSMQWRESILSDFWYRAEKYAAQAKDIAACRKETLLIYFATDAVKFLRPEAEQRLSKFGRVVFGLTEKEVGHVSPQWVDHDIGKVKEQAKALIGSSTASGKEITSVDDVLVKVGKSEKTVEMHGIMSMVEWWILANSNWLISHSGTSYSDTAGSFGLGPNGVMERLDVVHSRDHASISFRRDWDGDGCSPVGAANKEHLARCANMVLPNH